MYFSDCLNYIYRLKEHAIVNRHCYRRANRLQQGQLIDAKTIPKYVTPLTRPLPFAPQTCCGDPDTHYYAVDISEFDQQILPKGYPKTRVFGYGGFVQDPLTRTCFYHRCTPGPTFEALRGTRIKVAWINRLIHQHIFAIDPTLHWANPNNMPMNPPKPWPEFPPGFFEAQWPVTTVAHVHGGENPADSDGYPESWQTFNGLKGPVESADIFTYPNCQEPATLWYHDHALGVTRLNIYAGLSGFYLLREPCYERNLGLPSGKYDIPLAIQDRSFYEDGSLAFVNVGDNPDIHPYWQPEFFGNTIMVNGKLWPKLCVERRKYRFRILNNSNARFYHLFTNEGIPMFQIGTDGGYLEEPVELNALLIAPSERADVIIDFSSCKPGTKIILRNDAIGPYPSGSPVDPETTGQIMLFEVIHSCCDFSPLPRKLNYIPKLVNDSPDKYFVLNEIEGPNGPVVVLLNNQHWEAPISEISTVGATEDWIFVNTTMDTHPIHIHLIEFQPISRQPFDAEAYAAACPDLNAFQCATSPDDFVTGPEMPPDPNERGWKDTIRCNPGELTKVRIRFAPQSLPLECGGKGVNSFPFDPTKEPGYVWHCHMLAHEDNDMMRPYKLVY